MENNLKIEYIPIEEIKPYENNAKLHPKEQIQQIKNSILEFGFNDPIAVWHDNEIIEGHGRHMAALELELKEVPIIRLDSLTDEQRRAYMLVHNKLTMNSDFDMDMLGIELDNILDIDMSDFGFEFEELAEQQPEEEHASIVEKFIVPPFSVLDTRKGYWQERKRAWKALGIESETGRKENLLGNGLSKLNEQFTNSSPALNDVSIFDPVLTEIMYRWFNIDGGKIFDCFAGGSVRGIVAAKLGYDYYGIDLRQEQIDANVAQAEKIGLAPHWYCDDSLNADKYIEDNSVDMLFTCPPYADLEVYSDDARDISNMEYEDFCKVYREILTIACRKLKDDRFAVVVIGDVRDKQGAYRRLVDYTRTILADNGLHLYNDFVLVETVGTGAFRVTKQFNAKRKVVKTHQNVLCFYKGNMNNIKANFKEFDISDDDINQFITE